MDDSSQKTKMCLAGEVRGIFALPPMAGRSLIMWRATVSLDTTSPAIVSMELPAGRTPTARQFLAAFLPRAARDYAHRCPNGN